MKTWILLVPAMVLAFAARAEHADKVTYSPKIDTWMEGTVMMIDADGGKLSVRGAKKPYASAYARLLQDIDAKTRNLNEADRTKKIAEVRAEHRDAMNKALLEKSDADSDFTFYLPSDELKHVVVLDETNTYGVADDKIPATAAYGTKLNTEERGSMAVLKDLKVGQRVVIGYAKGVVYNNSYAIIKVAGGSVRASHISTDAEGRTKVDKNSATQTDIKTGVHPTRSDLDTTAAIRRAIVADKSLSTAAHNIKIFTENGIVTLRGAVNSEAERQSVAEKAATSVTKEKVINEMEVKP